MAYGIYSITNMVTGDKYIGQTRVDFKDRWNHHAGDLKNNRHKNEILQRAWNKYGENAFEFKAVHICDELDILNDLEIYYIKKYDTFNNGYNLTSGGDTPDSYEISKESRIKMLNNLKKSVRSRSNYTEHQIANLKRLLADEKYIGKVAQISKLTGINKDTISSVKALSTWVDVRADLNDKIKSINDKESRNKKIVSDFMYNNLTVTELCKKYSLSESGIYFVLNTNKLKSKIATINKANKNLKLENKILDAYHNGINNYSDMEKEVGVSRLTIEKLISKYGISLNKYKRKKATVKNINWDKSSKRYLIRLTKNKKQIVIGGVKDLQRAVEIRNKAKEYIQNNEDEKLSHLIDSLKSRSSVARIDEKEISPELDKYRKMKPKYIRVDNRPKQLPRFEIYIKGKYKGSSKVLDEAIKIRDEIIKELG